MERYILLKRPPESDQWFQSYEQLEDSQNKRKQKKFIVFLAISHNQCSWLPNDSTRLLHICELYMFYCITLMHRLLCWPFRMLTPFFPKTLSLIQNGQYYCVFWRWPSILHKFGDYFTKLWQINIIQDIIVSHSDYVNKDFYWYKCFELFWRKMRGCLGWG